MNKNIASLQDGVLNALRKQRIPVLLHITNGYQMRGTVIGFDNFVIILESDGKQMMIYKHAVSSITPQTTVKIYDMIKTEDSES